MRQCRLLSLIEAMASKAAHITLGTAMRNGADWIIREGRHPTSKEVLEYVHRATPDTVARWQLDGANRGIAESRAQAVIERALQAAGSGGRTRSGPAKAIPLLRS